MMASSVIGTQEITVNVQDVADAPTLALAMRTISQDSETDLVIDLVSGGTDTDPSPSIEIVSHTIAGGASISGLPEGFTVDGTELTVAPGNTYDYLDSGESRAIVVTYEILEETDDPVEQEVTITITGTNDAPRAYQWSFNNCRY